jgi:predicted HicB family RNase H-like nuclease
LSFHAGGYGLRLPDSLHRKLREIAKKDDVSINQFIATAVAERRRPS